MKEITVAVIGATGIAGQQFLAALENHPYFRLTRVVASPRSAGKSYREAIRSPDGSLQWYADSPCAREVLDMTVADASTLDPTEVDLAFTALESDAARTIEPRLAQHIPVISTASAFRYEEDVPILIPGVNSEHIPLIRRMQRERGWKGYIVPNPNCTTIGLAITLAPLHRRFGVKNVVMTSLQAVSGAGRSPGVSSMDILDNVVPYIPKEEEKVELETRKLLGRIAGEGSKLLGRQAGEGSKLLGRQAGEGIELADFRVSATCTRVPVLEGHTESVAVSLKIKANVAEVSDSFQDFGRELVAFGHPSAPRHFITLHDDPFRPQPRLDRDAEEGMTTSVGRIRECPVLENGIKYVLVSHNTKMGAARGALLMAEELGRWGFLGR